jgi:RimJ/RimL family protein N-acetyltransferase
MAAPAIVLRQWQDRDLDPYAAMNTDPVVMEFFPKPLTRDESAASLARQRTGIARRGWGLWAVEVDGVFAGFTGLAEPGFAAPFTPCVEIGWRFRREFWGRGLAFAAATAAVAFGFNQLQLLELVSFTAAINLRSRRLMERLEFTRRDREDFLHPLLAPDSPLRRHVLYRRSRPVTAPPVPSTAVIIP